MGVGKIARRGFLIGSVAVLGGVGFGVWKVRQPFENPLRPEEGAALNPFVVIDQSGVTLVIGRAEMGQGAQTTAAAMLAEELDLEWETVRVVHGPAAPAYHNAGLASSAAPGPDYARSEFQERIGALMGGASRLFGLQITGGSTSTRDAYATLRHAGASAREALKLAAADRLGVAVAELRTEGGAVIAPDGTRLAYAELAEAAARIEAPQVEPRAPEDWRLLGRSLPRPDMIAKSTGTAEFGIDIRLPGMVYAAPRMSPRFGVAMSWYREETALAVPGVQRVIALEEGCLVVASNSWAAMEGARRLEIGWPSALYPSTTEAVFHRIAEAFEGRRNARGRNDGDVEAMLGGSEGVVEAEYRVPFLAHATMEPMNATALWRDGRLSLWVGNQTPRRQVSAVAEALGISEAQVEVHTPYLGGGFGRRLEADFSVLAARAAQAMPDVPVQVVWSREEDMTHDFYRPGAIARMRGRVEGGRAVAFDAKIAAPSVMHQAGPRMLGLPFGGGPDSAMLEGLADQPYAIENYRVEGYVAELPIPLGFWRSVGASHNGFFHEGFIDELAHLAGRDPLESRLELVEPVSAVAASVLRTVGEMAGWAEPKRAGTGRGVAFTWSFGTPVAQVIELEDRGGRIKLARAFICCDVGRAFDPRILESQMESGLIFGLSAAIHGKITFRNGEVQEQNFPDYDALRMSGAPRIETRILEGRSQIGGAGEPATPPAAAALVNALFDLTGERVRELPLGERFDFLL